MKKYKIYLILVLLLLSMITLQAQTDSLSKKIEYTKKDYHSFMKKNRNYFGLSFFYDWQNFPNAANKQWMSNMQSMGSGVRILWHPLLVDAGVWFDHFGKINSPYQIPSFQLAKVNEYSSGGFVSLSAFPPYIPMLKRIQEYITPFAGIGYQWNKLYGWAFNSYDGGYYKLDLQSWYWKIGCNIFLGDLFPLDLFVEYAHTLNSDKIRNYEWIRIGVALRYNDLLKNAAVSKKSYSKPLIHPK